MREDLDELVTNGPQTITISSKALQQLLCSTEDSVDELADINVEIRDDVEDLTQVIKDEMRATREVLEEVKKALNENTQKGTDKADEVIKAIEKWRKGDASSNNSSRPSKNR